jgi:putative transposase
MGVPSVGRTSVRPTEDCPLKSILLKSTSQILVRFMGEYIKEITSEFHIHKRTLPHWQLGGRTYFITFRSAIGSLTNEALIEIKNIILDGHSKKYEVLFGVVMLDHVHLLLRPLEKESGIWYDLAVIMKGIKGSSARKINISLGRIGTVWQDEYFDRMIRSDEELIEKMEYIWNNPLKKGLADSFDEYMFYIRPEERGVGKTDGLKSVPLNTIQQ